MDFNQLMAKMRELDQPASTQEQLTTEMGCGAPMPTSMPGNDQPPPTHPSMSVNLNAQGLDNIESLIKLMTKVNPDMINQPKTAVIPPLSVEPSMLAIKPSLPPMKMLPDFDDDKMDLPPMHDKDHAMMKKLDKDRDGDHDMDDHDLERKGKDEAYGNSVAGSEPEYSEIDAVLPAGNDLNRPKKSFSGKPYRGDNPMAAGAYESKEQLRAGIRAELMQRLAETKGAK